MDDNLRSALRRTADFFEANAGAFTTGSLARDKHGNGLLPDRPDATCWCVVGRLFLELGEPVLHERDDQMPAQAYYRAVREAGADTVRLFGVNDAFGLIPTIELLRGMANA